MPMSAPPESRRRVRRILASMHIELHRTFRELLINEPADDTQTLYPGSGTLQLPALLDELRVVILSEGGSGKTEEIPVSVRIDTPIEVDYYEKGGILPFVLEQLMA